jgi:hypothetical protein
MPLSDYIGPHEVAEAHDVPLDRLENVRAAVGERAAGIPAERRRPHPVREDLDYAVDDRLVFLFDRASGTLLAGESFSFPVAMEGTAGRNCGAEIRWLSEHLDRRRSTLSYSIAGFRAARSAHRLHVERALARGDHVPEAVLADYERRDGRLVLKAPYSPEEHADWVAQARLRRAQEELDRATQGYEVRFLSAHDFLEVRPDAESLHGAAFSAMLAQETGAPLALVRRGDDLAWLHVQAGDAFVNMFGVCREADLVIHPDEGITRLPRGPQPEDEGGAFFSGLRFPQDPPEVDLFPDVETLLEALASPRRAGLGEFDASLLRSAMLQEQARGRARELPAYDLALEAVEARLAPTLESPEP